MRTLLLMRHAEAEPSHPDGDFKRPLTRDGEKKAKSFGELLRDRDEVPYTLMASAAERATDTARQVADGLRLSLPMISQSRSLYDWPPDKVLWLLRLEMDTLSRILVIGHNPTMSALARDLGAEIDSLKPCECCACYFEGPWRDLGKVPLTKSELLRVERD